MAKEKKFVQAITSRDEDFAQWYTDVVREAKLCDYSSVKDVLIIFQMDMQSGRRSRQTLTRDLKRQVLKTYICQC